MFSQLSQSWDRMLNNIAEQLSQNAEHEQLRAEQLSQNAEQLRLESECWKLSAELRTTKVCWTVNYNTEGTEQLEVDEDEQLVDSAIEESKSAVFYSYHPRIFRKCWTAR